MTLRSEPTLEKAQPVVLDISQIQSVYAAHYSLLDPFIALIENIHSQDIPEKIRSRILGNLAASAAQPISLPPSFAGWPAIPKDAKTVAMDYRPSRVFAHNFLGVVYKDGTVLEWPVSIYKHGNILNGWKERAPESAQSLPDDIKISWQAGIAFDDIYSYEDLPKPEDLTSIISTTMFTTKAVCIYHFTLASG